MLVPQVDPVLLVGVRALLHRIFTGLMEVQSKSPFTNKGEIKNRKAGFEPASQGWRETFSLDSYCPHPSNHSPGETIVTSLRP